MQCFVTNMAWLVVAMALVVMAYLKTGSLHSFWFLGVYLLGHATVQRGETKTEAQDDSTTTGKKGRA